MAQIAPVWLRRTETLEKACAVAELAASQGCRLVVFGEALAPGYPFWIERTDGARFDDPKQKAIFAQYLDQGVVIERGDLEPLQAVARRHGLSIYIGVMERAPDRGGHSLYCSLVYIDAEGRIGSVHRKLQPTYEERMAWAQGDGHGLRVHDLAPFRVGGLNCFENWMPLSRAALYAQGEDLHIAAWPGGLHNTQDLTRFVAREARGFVVSVSGLMRPQDFPADTPALAEILANSGPFLANGGSAIALPDGRFLVEPIIDREVLIVAELDHALVRGERQNFDLAGHYGRPDVTRLTVDRRRQRIADFIDETG
ncbi:carbon-nitrogen hydrolase family protein [Phenylobacterium sp. LjRoot225]|uniref:carbon-nitrogen hydrolase family protein n=1 Tax=Phenylobacterium sp. LjRoot225 TaxID=3342285 RepID=UPI003ED105F2